MPQIQTILREKTHKGEGLSLAERVFYVLTDVKSEEHVRTAKTLALVIERLNKAGALTDKEIDEILLKVAV